MHMLGICGVLSIHANRDAGSSSPPKIFGKRKGKSEDVLEDWTLINTLPGH